MTFEIITTLLFITVFLLLIGFSDTCNELESKVKELEKDDELDDKYAQGVSLALARLAKRVNRLHDDTIRHTTED